MSSQNGAPLIRVNRYVWLLLAVVVVALLLYQIRGALIPFVVGGRWRMRLSRWCRGWSGGRRGWG